MKFSALLLIILINSSNAADSLFISQETENIFQVGDTSGSISNIQKINSTSDSSNCIFVEHSFRNDSDGKIMTVIQIQSNLKQEIKYDAYLFGYKNKKWIYTSSCPLSYLRAGFESWPFKVDSMMLTNLRTISSENNECK